MIIAVAKNPDGFFVAGLPVVALVCIGHGALIVGKAEQGKAVAQVCVAIGGAIEYDYVLSDGDGVGKVFFVLICAAESLKDGDVKMGIYTAWAQVGD